jgi:hypothetical protein
MTREVALSLLSAWLASWATEGRALDAAGRANLLSPTTIAMHLAQLRLEREQVVPLFPK